MAALTLPEFIPESVSFNLEVVLNFDFSVHFKP